VLVEGKQLRANSTHLLHRLPVANVLCRGVVRLLMAENQENVQEGTFENEFENQFQRAKASRVEEGTL
jgi:hypothetical protein